MEFGTGPRKRGRPRLYQAYTDDNDPREAKENIEVLAGIAIAGTPKTFRHDDGTTTELKPDLARKIVDRIGSFRGVMRHELILKMVSSSEELNRQLTS